MRRFLTVVKGWRLAVASRVELVDTAVRVSEENRRLHEENAALKARLRRVVVRCERRERELADVREFLSVVEIGDVK